MIIAGIAEMLPPMTDERRKKEKRIGGTAVRLPLAAAVIFLLVPGSPASVKRLQVVADRADIYLDPDSRSPVIQTLEKGSILTMASAAKTRLSWYYVYFPSPETGKTRAGYILESFVRKLFPDLHVIQIGDESEIVDPREINLDREFSPSVRWGMAKEKVIQTEGRPLHQERSGGLEILRYKRDIMDKMCLVEFVFSENQLVKAYLYLMEKYADKNRYISDYLKLKNFLTGKFGEPGADKIVWQDPSYKDNSDRWGMALSLGHLEFHSGWTFPGTEFLITLAGGDSEVFFVAEASGLNYKGSASF